MSVERRLRAAANGQRSPDNDEVRGLRHSMAQMWTKLAHKAERLEPFKAKGAKEHRHRLGQA